MHELYEIIGKAERGEIDTLLTAALDRYRQVYPEWEISMLSLEKNGDRAEQIDRMITFLEQLKKETSDRGGA